MSSRWSLLACALACAGCAQILGIEDPGGSGSGNGSDRFDAGAPRDGNGTKVPDAPGSGSAGSACAATPQWGAVTNYSAPGGISIAVGDVNHDGIQDAVVATITDVIVFPGVMAGSHFSFGASHALTPGTAIVATNLLVMDVDHDGFQDVVTWTVDGPLGPGSSTVLVHRQDSASAGTFEAPGSFAIRGEDVGALRKGNFNGDAFPDLVVTAGAAAQLFVGSTTGAFSFGESLGSNAQLADANDVTGMGSTMSSCTEAAAACRCSSTRCRLP